MEETWYLASDVQFCLISPLLIYPLWRWNCYGVIWLTFVTLVSLVGSISLFIVEDLPPTIIISRP